MIRPKKIIVIGGNAAGPSAAAKAKRVNPEADIILFEQGDFISTGTCEIPYVLGGDIKCYKEVVFFTPEEFESEKHVKVLVRHRVESINRRQKEIIVRDIVNNSTSTYSYDSLILATGAKSKKLSQLSSELKNVFYLKSIADLIKVKSYLKTNKISSAAIIGSGYIGIEAAEALSKWGCQLTIIEREQLPLPFAEPEVKYLVRELFKEHGISFYPGVETLKTVIKEDKLKEIVVEGRSLEFDLVLVSIGFQPENTLAIASGLELGKSGALKVDRKLHTSDSSIFAAGDNIEVINAITNKPEYMPFAPIAHNSGHIAGANAAGGNSYADPVVKNSALKIFDNVYVSVGLTFSEAKAHGFNCMEVHAVSPNLVKVMPGSKNVFGKIVYEKGTLKILGASFFGGNEVSGYGDLISALIISRTAASILEKISYNYTPPVSPFINLLSVLGHKIR
ncbi:MAG: FAD-dependent oxidoreductase [Methanococcaceae archaeon]